MGPDARAGAEARRVDRMTRGVHDHTAPYRCGLEGCKVCEGKPSYRDWWRGIDTREQRRRKRG